MPPNQNRPQATSNLFSSPNMGLYLVGGIVVLALIGFLWFGTSSTDLTCTRSPLQPIECSLVRHTPLRTRSPVKILQPLAVDVKEYRKRKAGHYFSAELRVAEVNRAIPLVSSYEENDIYTAAKELNTFLQTSTSTYFSKKYPNKFGF